MAKLFITIVAILIACSFASAWSGRRSGSFSGSVHRSYSGYGSRYYDTYSTGSSGFSGDYASFKKYRLSNQYKRNSINNGNGVVFVQNSDGLDSLATYLD